MVFSVSISAMSVSASRRVLKIRLPLESTVLRRSLVFSSWSLPTEESTVFLPFSVAEMASVLFKGWAVSFSKSSNSRLRGRPPRLRDWAPPIRLLKPLKVGHVLIDQFQPLKLSQLTHILVQTERFYQACLLHHPHRRQIRLQRSNLQRRYRQVLQWWLSSLNPREYKHYYHQWVVEGWYWDWRWMTLEVIHNCNKETMNVVSFFSLSM